MKKPILLLTLFLLSIKGFCQKVLFAYDAAGNRIKREIVLTKQKSKAKTSSSTEYTDMLDDIKVKILPNPTEGLLKVTISPMNKLFDLDVYNASGKMIASSKSNQSNAEIDITNQPDGLYILVITSNENKTTWKIIKTNE